MLYKATKIYKIFQKVKTYDTWTLRQKEKAIAYKNATDTNKLTLFGNKGGTKTTPNQATYANTRSQAVAASVRKSYLEENYLADAGDYLWPSNTTAQINNALEATNQTFVNGTKTNNNFFDYIAPPHGIVDSFNQTVETYVAPVAGGILATGAAIAILPEGLLAAAGAFGTASLLSLGIPADLIVGGGEVYLAGGIGAVASQAGKIYNETKFGVGKIASYTGKFFKSGTVVLNTGGRQLNNVRATLKADEEAVKFYEMVRNKSSNMDVSLISKNTGMPIFQVQRIKQHLFFDTHQLASGIERFAPDIEIADAWTRLQLGRGTFVKQDINLLQHEYFEARFKGIFKTDYITAHNVANDLLRTWNPNEFITTPDISWRP